MEKVTESIKPVVGKYYIVTCAQVQILPYAKVFEVPILGIEHIDKQFFNHKHYHIDGRFIDRKIMRHFSVTDEGKTNDVIITDNNSGSRKFIGLIDKKIRCKRLTTGLNIPENVSRDHKIIQWQESMVGKSCEGKRCPHLGTLMNEEDGKLICPLHNLIGDIKKEVIVSQW